MKEKKITVIPRIFSGAGACLTAENWREAGVSVISCSLTDLIFKPGLDLLFQIKNFADYVGWSGKWVLNATMPAANLDHSYTLLSPYDGSKLHILPETIQELIQHLKPDYAIFPQELALEKSVLPFLESNKPAEDACLGIAYCAEGSICLLDESMEMQFAPLANDCECPTCKQGFTCAYFHHLLTHTPLLAQRLLIMHNVYWLNTQS